ncbi:MAG: hypothetical protein ACOYN5_01385 [Bacteroidales bacterium]
MEAQPKQTRLEQEIQELGDQLTKEQAQELREMSKMDAWKVSSILLDTDSTFAEVKETLEYSGLR